MLMMVPGSLAEFAPMLETEAGLNFLCWLFDEGDGDAKFEQSAERYVLLQLFWQLMRDGYVDTRLVFGRITERRRRAAADSSGD
jgi:hypothetical protein